MSTRITSEEGKCAFFDSTTGLAFGPVFDDAEDAQAFQDWLGFDPRAVKLDALEQAWLDFKVARLALEGRAEDWQERRL